MMSKLSQKLNDVLVRDIRVKCERCRYCGLQPTHKHVANRFGISVVTLWKILTHQAWDHVKGPPSPEPSNLVDNERIATIAKLEQAGITWRDADELRLAAQIFTCIRSGAFKYADLDRTSRDALATAPGP